MLIDTAKLYEVQKYCSLTNHVWAGFHASFNVAAWKKLPPDLQEIVPRATSREAALAERQDFVSMTTDRAAEPDRQGSDVQRAGHEAIPRCAGARAAIYPDMKKTAGDKAWALLEKYVGPLTA